ncbi:MAG: hypothetical protein ACXVZX_02670 [Terriglobales bacterium]
MLFTMVRQFRDESALHDLAYRLMLEAEEQMLIFSVLLGTLVGVTASYSSLRIKSVR